MVLPILSYGQPMLRQQSAFINRDQAGLQQLVADMWDTMLHAGGCGLAAVQVGQPIQLFMIDSIAAHDEMHPESRIVYFEDNQGLREVFINARIISVSERTWLQEEACLSMPGVQAMVERPWSVCIEYFDQGFNLVSKTISGITARMIQHEHDHCNGVLYLDHVKPAKKKSLEGKLKKWGRRQQKANYPML